MKSLKWKTPDDCSLVSCRVNRHRKVPKIFQLFGYKTNNKQNRVHLKNQDKQSCSFPQVAEGKGAKLLEGMTSILHLTCCSKLFCLFISFCYVQNISPTLHGKLHQSFTLMKITYLSRIPQMFNTEKMNSTPPAPVKNTNVVP